MKSARFQKCHIGNEKPYGSVEISEALRNVFRRNRCKEAARCLRIE
jgi:hypothetical protein